MCEHNVSQLMRLLQAKLCCAIVSALFVQATCLLVTLASATSSATTDT
jgi:hypothetical protein